MASIQPYGERRANLVDRRTVNAAFATLQRTGDGIRVSWGGIWAGVLASLGLALLLSALGVAIGISVADRGAGARVDSATGVFAVSALLVSLFVGGIVATRTGAIHDRGTGFWQGAIVWIVSILLMGVLAAGSVTSVVGGSFAVMGFALGPVFESVAPARAAWTTFAGLAGSLLVTTLGALVGRRRRPAALIAR